MRHQIISSIALAFTLGLSGVALAKRGPERQPNIEELAKKLDLTKEQQEKIKSMHKTDQESFEAKRNTVRTAEEAFREAMKKPESTPEQLTTLHDKFVDSQSDMQKGHFVSMLGLRSILTPEQLKKFSEFGPFRDGKQGRHGQKMGKGKGWFGGAGNSDEDDNKGEDK